MNKGEAMRLLLRARRKRPTCHGTRNPYNEVAPSHVALR